MSVPAEHTDVLYDFIGESGEKLDRVEGCLHREGVDISSDTLQLCFQLFHSMKGSAGFLKLDHLYELARASEVFFDSLCSGSIRMELEYSQAINDLCALIREALNRIPADCKDDFFAEPAQEFIARLNSLPGLERLSVDKEMNQEILEAFIWEVDDLLATAEQEFVLWEDVAGDAGRLTDLYRTFHRLTGNFSFYGYDDLMTLSGAAETILDRYLEGEVLQGEYPEEVFLQVIDAMRDTVASLARSGVDEIHELDPLLNSLQDVMRMPLGEIFIKAGFVESQTVEQALRVQENARAQQEQPRRLGEVLVAMGEVTADQLSQALARQKAVGDSTTQQEVESIPVPAKEMRVAGDVLQRKEVMVDSDRLQQMQNLIVQLRSRVDESVDESLLNLREQLEELYEVSKAVARAPVQTLVPRLNRLVHDLALRSEKQVLLRVIGEEVELERGTLEQLFDPLIHLLRNGVDHGIESPQRRTALGKDIQGQLTLSVLKRQDEIWASVEDDGSGLDLDKILNRAIRYGLVEAETSKVDSRKLASLIFKIGFTTAEKVTDSSGRGVGMDAVKKSLKKLGGRVDVFSRPGKGTRITLRIPV